jgi:hypothetical protein
VAKGLAHLGVELEFFEFGLSLDLSPSRKKPLEAQKASISLRPFRLAIFQQKPPHGGILRQRRNRLIQINLDRLGCSRVGRSKEGWRGKSLGTQHPALEEWFKWPLKRRSPLRTIRGTASLR